MYQFLSTTNPRFNPLTPKIVKEITTDDIIEYLKLDTWEARKIPNFREDQQEVGKSYHIRRFNNDPVEDTNYHDLVLKPYVSDKYKVLQYPKGVRWLDSFLMEGLLKVDSVFYVANGSKLCVTSTIGVEAEVVPGDTVRRYFILVLSHDGSSRMLGYCDTCPICENTLEMAKAEAFSKTDKHFSISDDNPEGSLEKAKQLIDLVRQRFYDESLIKYGAYAELSLEHEQIEYIFRTVINVPLKVEAHKLPEKVQDRYYALQRAFTESPGQHLRGDGNGWAVLGAVSNYGKHLGDTDIKQYQNDMFGTGRRMRNQTMQLLDQLLPESAIPVSETVAAGM